jgi:hypothetical protein
MNTIFKRTLAHAVFASFAIAAFPGHAADSRDTTVAASDTDGKTLVELCASSSNGMVPKEKVVKAIHRMLDMGETPEAVKMTKDSRRKMQFDVFWKEVQRESLGG